MDIAAKTTAASDAKGKDTKKLQKPQKGKGRGRGQSQEQKPRSGPDGGFIILYPQSRPHRRRKGVAIASQPTTKGGDSVPILRHKKTMFSYGNHDKHYAQRHHRNATVDPRLEQLLKTKGADFFAAKTVLDLGCGDGFLAFLAANFGARMVVGVDIDEKLISQALRYLRHLKSTGRDTLPRASSGAEVESRFPSSLVRCNGMVPFLYKPLILGPSSLAAVGLSSTPGFPYNLEFRTENAIVSDIDECRGTTYDVVLCCSMTKWVHVNFGDDGVKVLFNRCRKLLKPGGLLVLDPQPWNSYVRKNLTQQARHVFDSIKFRPQDFNKYLMDVLGFEAPEYVGACPPLKRTLQFFRRPGPLLWQPVPTPPSKIIVLSTKPPSISARVDTATSLSSTSCSVGRMDSPRPALAPIIETGSSILPSIEVADPDSDASSLPSTVPGDRPQRKELETGCVLSSLINAAPIAVEEHRSSPSIEVAEPDSDASSLPSTVPGDLPQRNKLETGCVLSSLGNEGPNERSAVGTTDEQLRAYEPDSKRQRIGE